MTRELTEEDELADLQRTREYARHLSDMPEKHLRSVMYDLAFSLYAALEDSLDIEPGYHPADIVVKHLQRGNIVKDGQW